MFFKSELLLLILLFVSSIKLSEGSLQIASFINYYSTDRYTISNGDIYKNLNLNIISAINAKGKVNFSYGEKYTWDHLSELEILTGVNNLTKLYQIFSTPEIVIFKIEVT